MGVEHTGALPAGRWAFFVSRHIWGRAVIQVNITQEGERSMELSYAIARYEQALELLPVRWQQAAAAGLEEGAGGGVPPADGTAYDGADV